jgi:endonuclease YncB( thermonuclease family)
MYEYKGLVERVVDGDTVIINFDLGFDVWKKERVRLARINCQELKTEEGKAAKVFMQAFTGVEVSVKTKKGKDIYGRYIGEITVMQKEPVNLSDLLVIEKLAVYLED